MPDSTRDPRPLSYIRSPELLSAANSRLLIVDVQEKLLPLIPASRRLVHNCRRLLDARRFCRSPHLGRNNIAGVSGRWRATWPRRSGPSPDKIEFSCVPVLGWGNVGELPDDRDQVVVAGMEAHVCVLQTALDLLSCGFRVFVAADAVASRSERDEEIALARMANSGATIVTVESILFEWCERAGTPEFKAIQQLILEGEAADVRCKRTMR